MAVPPKKKPAPKKKGAVAAKAEAAKKTGFVPFGKGKPAPKKGKKK